MLKFLFYSQIKLKCSTTKEDLEMSISIKGLEAKAKTFHFSIKITSKDIFVQLSNAISWRVVADLAWEDLKKTEKGFFWLGRKLVLRIHLGIMVLQTLLKATDRGITEMIKETPRFQVFCGRGNIPKWKVPHFTKVEEFRNRLSPETHRRIGNYALEMAYQIGLTNPSWMDIDSTVQEANIAYPSDASLMRKLAQKCQKALKFLMEKKTEFLPRNLKKLRALTIDMKAINRKAKEYFFLPKNCLLEKKIKIFAEYHQKVKRELKNFIIFSKKMSAEKIRQLPWNIQRIMGQVKEKGWRYLLDVAHFVRTHSIKEGKILSWHAEEVACIPKNKPGKERDFGRQVQLGRVDGNFIIAFPSTEVRMEDKKSVDLAIREHSEIFGPGILKEIGADKGYFSGKNVDSVLEAGINPDGLQRPKNVRRKVEEETARKLRNRRAGIEPLICHVKNFGLRKSRMKSDTATVASVYRSAMGFNLHQIMRKLMMKMNVKAA
jgi:hypothetical protein